MKRNFYCWKQETDQEGCILILDVSVNDSEYILFNLYNANAEKEQINVYSNMSALLEMFDVDQKKPQIIMAGDFNLFFDSKLDAQGRNPTIKK